MLGEKYSWAIQKSLFASTSQDSTLSHTLENSKMCKITSKYFSVFNNEPPAGWVAHITEDFLTCYSCSYYSSMIHADVQNCVRPQPIPLQRGQNVSKSFYSEKFELKVFLFWKWLGKLLNIWFFKLQKLN